MGKKLKTIVTEGKYAKEKMLRKMWLLRRDFLELNQTEENDWRYFSDFCSRDHTYLFTFFDSSGELQGFFTFTFKSFDKSKKRALLILSKYYYVKPAYRGHSTITSAAWRIIPRAMWKYGLQAIYVTAFVFPSSYVSLSRTFGGVKTIQKNTTTGWEKDMLEAFAEEIYGENWDKNDKLVRNQNTPFEENNGKTQSIQALRKEYEAINPRWRDGVSMPILMKLDFHTIHNIFSTNVRRMRRGDLVANQSK